MNQEQRAKRKTLMESLAGVPDPRKDKGKRASAISRIMSTLEFGLVDAIGVPKRLKDCVSAIRFTVPV